MSCQICSLWSHKAQPSSIHKIITGLCVGSTLVQWIFSYTFHPEWNCKHNLAVDAYGMVIVCSGLDNNIILTKVSRQYKRWAQFLVLKWYRNLIFFYTSSRLYQHVKDRIIWIPYARALKFFCRWPKTNTYIRCLGSVNPHNMYLLYKISQCLL